MFRATSEANRDGVRGGVGRGVCAICVIRFESAEKAGWFRGFAPSAVKPTTLGQIRERTFLRNIGSGSVSE